MNATQRKKVLLVGPYPPPYGGTPIPFKLFCDYLKTQKETEFHVRIVNTQSGDKSQVSLLNPRVLLKVVQTFCQLFVGALSAGQIVIFGSQRFVTIVASLTALLTRPLRKQVCVRIIGGSYDQYYWNRPQLSRAVIRRLLGLCARIVVETEVAAKSLSTVWPQQLRFIPNYRLPPTDRPAPSTNLADKVRFIYTGLIRRPKGCGELLEAFWQLKKRLAASKPGLRITLDLFGLIYDRPQDHIANLDAARQDPDITFHGVVAPEALLDAYAAADVFVFPSYWPTEGHSGSVIEAMMCGLPVVAARWRTTPEVVQHGINGLLCEPKDVASLLDCMQRMALDGELRARLAKGALETSRRFDSQIVGPQLAEALNL